MKSLIAFAAPWRAALLALVLGASLPATLPALGQATAHPPERMTYQGFLVDGNGDALGAAAPKNYDVIFRIYTDQSAGDLLWAEQQTVTVDKGYFSVLLGEGASTGEVRPALSTLFKGATASDRFVQITVKGIGIGGANVNILPRLRLLTSPYAFLAEQATKLVREDNNADLISSSGNVLSIGGHLDVLGNNSLEFGADVSGKQSDAGRMGYNLFGNAGNLDIMGAGTAANNRKIKLWAEGGLTIAGPVTATSFAGAHTGDGSGLTGVAKLGDNTFTGYQEIQNHLRIGEINTTVGVAGWGEALIFSGAPPVAAGNNSDNSDPLWMARYNTSANASELRMVIGDDPGSGSDAFVIGTMAGSGNFNQTATWAPKFGFTARGLLDFGYGRTKEVSAGTIGYQVHSTDSLDIVGAGTTGTNRKISMWAEGGAQIHGSLRVNGFANVNFNNFAYYARALNPGAPPFVPAFYQTVTGISSGTVDYSIVAERRIAATEFNAYSDARIKQVVAPNDSKVDLEKIMKLRPTHYRMLDVVTEGTALHIGFIAQEVSKVIPEAVHSSKQFIPDIYCMATAATFNPTNKTLTLGLPKAHSLTKGDRIRVIAKGGPMELTVQEAPKPDSVVLSGCEAPYTEVFVFGKEVPDFLAVNYNHVFTTAVGAVQELARRLEKQDAELTELRAELAQARGEKQSLADNLTAMDARLVRLEKILKQQAALGTEKAGTELLQVRN